MKSPFILLCCLCLSVASSFAQQKVAVFIQPEANFGTALEESLLETREYTGLRLGITRRSDFTLERLPMRSFGLGINGGLVLWNRMYLGTGIRYQGRRDKGIPYCYVCDFVPPSFFSSRKVSLDFVEVPLNLRMDLSRGQTRRFLSGEAYWSHSLNRETDEFSLPSEIRIQQWGYRLGAGLAYPLGKNWDINFRFFYEQEQDWGKPYPRYRYQVLGFKVGTLARL